MQYEVLLVDDNMAAAREYARLIGVATQLEALAVDDPTIALETLKTEPIKVIVLDQRMPGKKGTQLYKDLKAINPSVKVMMLSGEADTQELDDAFKLGYDDYLHKSRIKDLPSKVHILYVRYQSDILTPTGEETPVHVFAEYRGVWPFRQRVDYYLRGAKVLTDDYVFVDSWRTIKQISAGETVAETDTVEIETRFKYQSSTEAKAAQDITATAGHVLKLQGKIESAISAKFSRETYTGTKRQIGISREYKLPDAPANPAKLHVASRHFQRAPVYREIRALIVRTCSSCGKSDSFPIVVYQPTAKIATRHIDYRSDRSENVLLTGCEKF